MFDNDSHEDDEKEPTDYTGLIIGAILVPGFVLVDYLSNDDVALAVFIVLGMIMLAVKMRWDSRKHVWFWATIVFILALHTPLVFMVRWPHGNVPTLFIPCHSELSIFLVPCGELTPQNDSSLRIRPTKRTANDVS